MTVPHQDKGGLIPSDVHFGNVARFDSVKKMKLIDWEDLQLQDRYGHDATALHKRLQPAKNQVARGLREGPKRWKKDYVKGHKWHEICIQLRDALAGWMCNWQIELAKPTAEIKAHVEELISKCHVQCCNRYELAKLGHEQLAELRAGLAFSHASSASRPSAAPESASRPSAAPESASPYVDVTAPSPSDQHCFSGEILEHGFVAYSSMQRTRSTEIECRITLRVAHLGI